MRTSSACPARRAISQGALGLVVESSADLIAPALDAVTTAAVAHAGHTDAFGSE
jgi:hypothetical protein